MEQFELIQREDQKGVTSKNNVYYYEKDYTHGDVEVYQKFGSKGLHVGSVSMQGG